MISTYGLPYSTYVMIHRQCLHLPLSMYIYSTDDNTYSKYTTLGMKTVLSTKKYTQCHFNVVVTNQFLLLVSVNSKDTAFKCTHTNPQQRVYTIQTGS